MKNRALIQLKEISEGTLADILNLNVRDEQRKFVADNAKSIAQAYFSDFAWFRGIYLNDHPIGFVMLHDEPQKATYVLWRFMIDQRYQRKGFGKEAMKQIISHVKSRPNAKAFLTSTVPGEGSPQPFYESLGFVDTGEVEDGENVLRLEL